MKIKWCNKIFKRTVKCSVCSKSYDRRICYGIFYIFYRLKRIYMVSKYIIIYSLKFIIKSIKNAIKSIIEKIKTKIYFMIKDKDDTQF